MGMVEQVRTHSEVLRDLVYREVLRMSPALCTYYTTKPASKLGDSVRMVDGKVLTLDRRTKVTGPDLGSLAEQILESMRPMFGFMETTSHFAASIDVMFSDFDNTWYGLAIWGVA